jgi:7-cyano-7-deazaguanine synthase
MAGRTTESVEDPGKRTALGRCAPAHPVGNRAVVLLSGGLDSTVVLFWSIRHYPLVQAVTIDYGQSHRQELVAARRIASCAGAHLRMIRVRGLGLGVPHRGGSVFIRGRNLLAVGAAAVWSGASGADILLGSLPTDPYADCSPSAMAQFTATIQGPEGTGGASVTAPLHQCRDKADAARLGLVLGAPLSWSWSCMTPVRERPCGHCGPCASRDEALRRLDADAAEASDVPPSAWFERCGSPADRRPERAPGSHSELVADLVRWAGRVQWKEGWRYRAPDGTARFSPFHHPPRAIRQRFRIPGENRFVRVAERTCVGTPPSWELTALADGTVTKAVGDPCGAAAALAEMIVAATRDR